MNIISRFSLCIFLLMMTMVAVVKTAHAIPAFSREHNTECATCHTLFPELNEYGDAFKKNGFVWNKHKKDDKGAKTESDTAGKNEGNALLGAPRRSELLWLAGLPQTVPVSLSATLNAAYNDDANYDKVDLSTRAVSLLAGGVFQDKLGFFLKYNLYAEGEFNPAVSNTPVNLDSPYAKDVEEFYLLWRNTLNTPVNIKVGRFRPQLSLWNKTNKTSIADLATTTFRVGDSKFTADSPEDAIEANAVLFNRLFVAGGVVDRNGQDTNEAYGHVSLKIGGSDFRANEPDIDLDKESILDYMYLVIGGYGYSGRNSTSLASSQRNNLFRGGVETDLVIRNARFKFAWAYGRDSNPDFSSHQEEKTNVYAGQGEYLFSTNLLALVRYEYQKTQNGVSYERVIPSVSYSPLQNTKLTLEYQYVNSEYDGSEQDSNIALCGLRVSF